MSIARKILENTLVQFGGKIVTAVMSIFVLKMISGYLGTSGYGDYTTVYQFIAFFGIAADFGIFTITVKEMSKNQERIPYILANVMGLRTVLGVLTMGLALVSAFLIPTYHNTLIPLGVSIATLATIFTLLNSTVSTVLQAHLKMQYATIGLIWGKLASVGYIALVVYWLFVDDKTIGFQHLIWSGVLGNFVMFAVTSYYTARFTRIQYRFDFAFWKEIFITSLPYGVALILNGIYFRIDVILLTLLLPHTQTLSDGTLKCAQTLCGDTEAGLYGVGMRFLEMLGLIPIYYMNSVLPVMTRFLEEGKEKVRRVIQYSFDFLLAIALPILVGGYLLAAPIVKLVSDDEFLSGQLYQYGSDVAIQFLLFAMLFSFISTLFGFTLVVLNHQKKLMYINAVCVVFNILTNLIAIPHWGFRGAAFTTILCEIFIIVFTAMAVKKDVGLEFNYTTASKILAASAAMGGVLWGVSVAMNHLWFIWQLAVLLPVGVLTYGGMLLLTKAITPEMRAVLRKK